VKGLRVALIFLVTSFIMGFALGFLSSYLEAHGERPIAPMTRLLIIFDASGMAASIAGARGANRRVAQAAAGEEAEAKRCASVPDRASVPEFGAPPDAAYVGAASRPRLVA